MGMSASACWCPEDDAETTRRSGERSGLLRAADPARAGGAAAGAPALAVVSLGVMGTGRSSFINTLLDTHDASKVSGGQLRGTRGCLVVRGRGAVRMDFVDTEGLPCDQVVKPDEMAALVDGLATSLDTLGRVSVVLLTLDVEERQNSAMVANLVALAELFADCPERCFLCLSKWNSNAVQAEWNRSLLQWCRAHRRAKAVEDLAEDPPPTPAAMLEDYRAYLRARMGTPAEAAALERAEMLLDLFEGRLIWAYNLDCLQQEDREDGELPAHETFLFDFYRSAALAALDARPQHDLLPEDLALVRRRGDAMALATHCVDTASERALLLQ